MTTSHLLSHFSGQKRGRSVTHHKAYILQPTPPEIHQSPERHLKPFPSRLMRAQDLQTIHIPQQTTLPPRTSTEWDGLRSPFPGLGTTKPKSTTSKAENKKGKGEGWGQEEEWERRDGEEWGVIRFDRRKKTKGSNSSDQEPLHYCKEPPLEEEHLGEMESIRT